MKYLINNIKESPIDDRDYLVRNIGLDIPDYLDMRQWVLEVENQLQYGSCLANAGCSALEFYLKKAGTPRDLSRMYVYWFLRAMSGIENQDSGGYARMLCKTLAGLGAPDETTYPYIPENLYRLPTQQAILEGLKNNSWTYERIPLLGVSYGDRNTAIKEQLAMGFPVLFTIALNEQFYNLSGSWETHTWDYQPTSTNQFIGLHEVLAVGYNDRPHEKRFICLNSWGTNWGDNGYFGLEYNPAECDMWQWQTIREVWVIKPEN